MPSLTIKNVPQELYLRLKERAKRNRRSLNSEVIMMLELGARSRRVETEEIVAGIREVRARQKFPVDPELIRRAIREKRM